MAKTKGQKAIERENARMMREKKKQIEKANRMLIPVSKATNKSMNLVSFDPSGTFRFAYGRWVKGYRVIRRNEENQEMSDIVEKLHSEVRFTKKFGGATEESFVVMTLMGEIYDEVRTRFMEDEATLRGQIEIIPLSIDEVMTLISGKTEFHYASMVRGKKDWKEECFPDIEDGSSFFQCKGVYGECCFIMQYPETCMFDLITNLKELGCSIYLSIDLKGIDGMDQIDYNRALEQRYNRRLSSVENQDYLNLSLQLMFFCDSDDAREIIEKTVLSLFSQKGFVITSSMGAQKEAAESILSLGVLPRKYMRNVSKETTNEILGKEELWQ